MYLRHVHPWIRYIDDVLVIWGGTIEELHQFISELNANDRNIKLTFTSDFQTLSFLDLSISIVNCRLVTKTFRKQTTANTLLLASSHHPPSLIRGIPIVQFLRIRRNCSNEVAYHILYWSLEELETVETVWSIQSLCRPPHDKIGYQNCSAHTVCFFVVIATSANL